MSLIYYINVWHPASWGEWPGVDQGWRFANTLIGDDLVTSAAPWRRNIQKNHAINAMAQKLQYQGRVQCPKLLSCEPWAFWYLIIVFDAIHLTVFIKLSGKASARSQEKLCAGPWTECLAVTRTWLPGSIMVSARLLLSGSALLFVDMVLAVTKGERRMNAAPARC